MERFCSNCGNKLYDDEIFCPDCGTKATLAPIVKAQMKDEVQGDQVQEEQKREDVSVDTYQTELTDGGIYDSSEGRKKLKLPLIIGGISAAAVLLIILFVTGINKSPITNEQLTEIMRDHGLYEGSVEILQINELYDGNSRFDKDDLFVLFKVNSEKENGYLFVVVNPKTKETTPTNIGSYSLGLIFDYLIRSDEATATNLYLQFYDCIKKYGTNYFTSQSNCNTFLNKLTGAGGVIDLATARRVIDRVHQNFFQVTAEGSNFEDVTTLFTPGTAIVRYIAAKTQTLEYNWGKTNVPESVFDYYYSTLDQNTINLLKSMYGEPYVYREVWQVVELNSPEDIGEEKTYRNTSLEKIKEAYGVESADD